MKDGPSVEAPFCPDFAKAQRDLTAFDRRPTRPEPKANDGDGPDFAGAPPGSVTSGVGLIKISRERKVGGSQAVKSGASPADDAPRHNGHLYAFCPECDELSFG
jgi:hypothetical protein